MVALSVVLLSAAGIYALMSFTVSRRRREIGIRIALGARIGRVLAGIFARAMSQIGIGIVLGLVGIEHPETTPGRLFDASRASGVLGGSNRTDGHRRRRGINRPGAPRFECAPHGGAQGRVVP